MTRIALNEKLEKRKINLKEEITKINIFLFKYDIVNQEFCSNFMTNVSKPLFNLLDNKFGCISVYELSDLFLDNLEKKNLLNKFLEYCDFYLMFYKAYLKYRHRNIYYPSSYENKPFEKFAKYYEKIEYTLDKIDYQIIEKDTDFLIVPKDVVAEEVAGLDRYKDIKWRILEYNSYKTTLNEKRAILDVLYTKFEGKTKKNVISEQNAVLYNELSGIIQCARHGIDSPKVKAYTFFYDNEEAWCDKIYNLILEAFLHMENKKIIKEILDLKRATIEQKTNDLRKKE